MLDRGISLRLPLILRIIHINNRCITLFQLGLKPEFHLLDINNENSIQNFADFIKEKHDGIDVLVNNAAIAYKVLTLFYFIMK